MILPFQLESNANKQDFTLLFRCTPVYIIVALISVTVILNEIWKSIAYLSGWMIYFKYHLFGGQEMYRYCSGAESI